VVPVELFTTKVRHVDGGAVVSLRGELDVLGADELRRELRTLVHRYDADQVTFDLNDLRFIDTSGVVALVEGIRAMDGGRPTMLHPRPLTLRTLQLCGVLDRFEVVLDEGASQHV
jgi:anti-anti-sigma factor